MNDPKLAADQIELDITLAKARVRMDERCNSSFGALIGSIHLGELCQKQNAIVKSMLASEDRAGLEKAPPADEGRSTCFVRAVPRSALLKSMRQQQRTEFQRQFAAADRKFRAAIAAGKAGALAAAKIEVAVARIAARAAAA